MTDILHTTWVETYNRPTSYLIEKTKNDCRFTPKQIVENIGKKEIS